MAGSALNMVTIGGRIWVVIEIDGGVATWQPSTESITLVRM